MIPSVDNYQIAQNVMNTLVKKITRRSNEDNAIKVLRTVIANLENHYDFINYIQIVDNRYNDDFNLFRVDKNINSVPSNFFYNAINDLVKETIVQLEHVADYFFIREYRDSLGSKNEKILKEKGLNLDILQSNYILERQHMVIIKNDEVYQHVISTLLRILNKQFTYEKAIITMMSILSNLSKRYDFLNFISLAEIPDHKGSFEIIIYPDINRVWSLQLRDSIQAIIENTRKHMQWQQTIPFERMFKKEVGVNQVLVLERIGIDFNRLQYISKKENFKEITDKTLYAIFIIVSRITAESYAIASMDKIIQQVKKHYSFLESLQINSSQYNAGFNALSIDESINNVDSKELGHALKEIIYYISKNLSFQDKLQFIELIKKNLDNDTLSALEHIGLNLHILELKIKNI
jgi:hypothetical protein